MTTYTTHDVTGELQIGSILGRNGEEVGEERRGELIKMAFDCDCIDAAAIGRGTAVLDYWDDVGAWGYHMDVEMLSLEPARLS